MQNEFVVRRWYKEILKSDAQRLPTSNPSGHVTLTKAQHPIDQGDYFRDSLFAGVRWTGSRAREQAVVPFEISFFGDAIGTHELLVDHYPAFESGQRNRSTTIRWGHLNAKLRYELDIDGSFLTIELTSLGRFRLLVDDGPAGVFL